MTIVNGNLYRPERFCYHETEDRSRKNELANNEPIFVRGRPEYISEQFSEKPSAGGASVDIVTVVAISALVSFIIYIICSIALLKLYLAIGKLVGEKYQ